MENDLKAPNKPLDEIKDKLSKTLHISFNNKKGGEPERDAIDNFSDELLYAMMDELKHHGTPKNPFPAPRPDVHPPINDNVNHPKHYVKGGLECIDVIKAAVTDLNGFEGYTIGNVIKYCWRWKSKGGIEDLRKAQKYLEFLIKKPDSKPDSKSDAYPDSYENNYKRVFKVFDDFSFLCAFGGDKYYDAHAEIMNGLRVILEKIRDLQEKEAENPPEMPTKTVKTR